VTVIPSGDEHNALQPHEKQQTDLVHNSAVAVISAARALEVRTLPEAQHATEVLQRIAGERKRAEQARDFLVRPLNDHVREINARFKGPRDLLDEAREIVQRKVILFNAEQAQRQREKQARIDAEAAAQRRADEAERQRQADIAREQQEVWEAEQRRRAADAIVQPSPEADEAARDAQRAVDAMAALAEARMNAPLPERRPEIVPPVAPVSKGVVAKRRWTFEVVGKVPIAYMAVDEQAIRRVMREDIRATGKPQPIAGVRFYQEDELQVRAR
jgi:hypothetical protein